MDRSAGLSTCNAPNGYRAGDVDPHGNLSPGVNRASGHANSKTDGFVQGHHPIQDAWTKKKIVYFTETLHQQHY